MPEDRILLTQTKVGAFQVKLSRGDEYPGHVRFDIFEPPIFPDGEYRFIGGSYPDAAELLKLSDACLRWAAALSERSRLEPPNQ